MTRTLTLICGACRKRCGQVSRGPTGSRIRWTERNNIALRLSRRLPYINPNDTRWRTARKDLDLNDRRAEVIGCQCGRRLLVDRAAVEGALRSGDRSHVLAQLPPPDDTP